VNVVAQKPQSTPVAAATIPSEADKIAKAIASEKDLTDEAEVKTESTVAADTQPVPVATPKESMDEPIPEPSQEAASAPVNSTDSRADDNDLMPETVEGMPTVQSKETPGESVDMAAYVPPPPPAKVSLTSTPPSLPGPAPAAPASTEQPAPFTQTSATAPASAENEVTAEDDQATSGLVPVEKLTPLEDSFTGNQTAQSDEAKELFDHHKDYMWIQGKMIHIYSRGGYWQVRYASYEDDDEFGGKFILVGTVPEEIKDGDFVRVRGKVLGENRWLSGTEYRIDSIQVVEKPAATASR
jgi:hypothetical protein